MEVYIPKRNSPGNRHNQSASGRGYRGLAKGPGAEIAECIAYLKKAGHATDEIFSMTLRQASAWMHFHEVIRKRELAELVTVARLARAEKKVIQRFFKMWGVT